MNCNKCNSENIMLVEAFDDGPDFNDCLLKCIACGNIFSLTLSDDQLDSLGNPE